MASDVSNSLNSRLPQDDEPNGAANTNAPANINAPVITGNSATVSLPDNRLVCVEYPGFVINVDKMLDTIGGEKGVSKVNVTENCVVNELPQILSSNHSYDLPARERLTQPRELQLITCDFGFIILYLVINEIYPPI